MSLLPRIINKAWQLSSAKAETQFHRAARAPEPVQRNILAHILNQNVQTEIGRRYNFESLRGVEAFQNRLPLLEYEDLKHWIEEAAAGGSAILTRDKVDAFLPTSGTNTGSKLIPWTSSFQRELQNAIGPWLNGFMKDCPAAWHGPAYWSISPPAWPAAKTSGGIPIGFSSDTSYLGGILHCLLSQVMAAPAEVAGLKDATNWKYTTLAFLLKAGNLSLISVWSPTFLTALLEPLTKWLPRLLTDLENGTLSLPNKGDEGKTSELSRLLGRQGRRASELRRIEPEAALYSLNAIWPKLAAISCWTDAASRAPACQLGSMFPNTRIVSKGLVATEGIVSIPLPGAAFPALALTSHFYEFLDDDNHVHPAWDLKIGNFYSIVLTTGAGLWRYRLHDRVRIAGFYEQCPLIEFIGREGVTSDTCGEKLSEPFVRDCLVKAARSTGEVWTFSLLAPTSNMAPHRYCLFLATNKTRLSSDCSHIERAVDEALCENVHYAHARRTGQLGPVRAHFIRGDNLWAWSRYQNRFSAEGMRIGDIKPCALDPRTGWESFFEIGEPPFANHRT